MASPRTPHRHAEALLVVALITLAVAARVAGWRWRTPDMDIFLAWSRQLRHVEGGRQIGAEVGNYNAPFVYLLVVLTHLPGPLMIKLKATFVLFDVVLAFFAYRIVGLRFAGFRRPMAAALVVVLLPTVVINASLWGQMDAMWAAFAVGAVYFLRLERHGPAVAMCAVSLAVKPQGIFLFPLLLLLALAGRLRWRTVLTAPAVLLALDLPALIAGRDPVELFTIYGLDRQGSHVATLTVNAPSVYAFIAGAPNAGPLRILGYLFAATAILLLSYILIFREIEVLSAATLFALLVPFTLPGMHERYFFLADVLTVILAFHHRRLWPVPLLVQAASLLSYERYLLGAPAVPLVVPATLMAAALVMVARHTAATATVSRPSAARPAPLPARPV
ncbi:glycosyltransferase 87 family protein [Actinoplanes sp. CA-030573]|uniref:glycosyltransferase 87 family protein n=1 Tax=Actinoplanes sp. CA-030573 TaxID=3239898 RepID=UPI003D8F4304